MYLARGRCFSVLSATTVPIVFWWAGFLRRFLLNFAGTEFSAEPSSGAPMLERQEHHNEGTLTALITTNRSHYKMEAI